MKHSLLNGIGFLSTFIKWNLELPVKRFRLQWPSANFQEIPYLAFMPPSVEMKWRFPTLGHQRVLKLRGDAQQIFVNGEFSGGSSGFWDYTIYVNPYMVVRPEGHYTKHIYVNSQRIASKIGNPEDYEGGDPTVPGSSAGKKVMLEEVVEENFTELFGSIPEIEPAADESLGMSHGGGGGEPHQYWFTADHQVSLPLDKYRKVAVDFCSDQGARKEYSLSYTTGEQRRYEQKDQDLVCLNVVVMTLRSSAFVTDASGVAIQHLEIDRREIREPPLKQEQGREQYMAFGEVFVDQRRTGFGTPYKFNAKELDCESGYYYYEARYYDPRMARFISVDPLASEMPAWGSYTYTFNNPIRLVDPTGMRPEETDWEPKVDSEGNITYVSEDGDSYRTFVEQYGEDAARSVFESNCEGCFDKGAVYSEGEVSLGSEVPLRLRIGKKSSSKGVFGGIIEFLSGGSGEKSVGNIQDVVNQLEFIKDYGKTKGFSNWAMNDYFSSPSGGKVGSFTLTGPFKKCGNSYKYGYVGYNSNLTGDLPISPTGVHLPQEDGYKYQYRRGDNVPALLLTRRNEY